MYGSQVYFYILNATSGATESVPGIIAPDTNPGNKRWILQGTPDNQIDDRSYGMLEAANTAAYNAGKLLVISKNWTLTANTVLTASVKRIPGGSFTKASTYTLTFNGEFTNSDNGQCFIGFAAGDVTFAGGAVEEVYAEWWGIDGIADDVQINTAMVAHFNVYLSGVNYSLSASIIPLSHVKLFGRGKSSTYITLASDIVGLSVSNVNDIEVRDILFIASNTQTNPIIEYKAIDTVIARNHITGVQIAAPGAAQTFTAIKLYATGSGAIWNCYFEDISVSGVGTVVEVEVVSGGTAWMNNNRFEKFYLNDFVTGIYFVSGGGGFTFRDWGVQCSARTTFGLRAYDGGGGTILDGVQWIDMPVTGIYYQIGPTITDIKITPPYGDIMYDEMRVSDQGINTDFIGNVRYFSKLVSDGHFLQIPTNTGWTETVTGSGSTIQSVAYNQTRTGTTVNSTAVRYTDVLAGFSSANLFAINFNKTVVFVFNIARVVSEANAIGRVHLRAGGLAEDLAMKGIGIKIANFALYGESYGDTGEFVDLGTTLEDGKNYQIKIIVYGGIRAEWWVNGVYKAQQPTTTKIPYGTVVCYFVHSLSTSISDPSGDAQMFLMHPRLSVEK